MKYTIVFAQNLLFLSFLFSLTYGQGLVSDIVDGVKRRIRGNSTNDQSASTSAITARHSPSTSSSSISSGTSSRTTGESASSPASSAISTSTSRATSRATGSTSTTSSDSHAFQERNSHSRHQIATRKRIRNQESNTGNQRHRQTGLVIREPSNTSQPNTRSTRSRVEEIRQRAQFKGRAEHRYSSRKSKLSDTKRYMQHILNKRPAQDPVDAHVSHMRAQQTSRARGVVTRSASHLARSRERDLAATVLSTSARPPTRQRLSRASSHRSMLQDQVVPDLNRQPNTLISTPNAVQTHQQSGSDTQPHTPTISEQNRRGSRTNRQPTTSHHPGTSSSRYSNQELIVVQHPSLPDKPIFGVAFEVPFEDDRKGKRRKKDN